VFLDNVSLHKVDGVQQAIEARGASLYYLPAYSPGLNPIEQFFGKLKAILRKTAARTVTTLCKAIAACLKTIPNQSALRTSPTQDMVNLSGERSKRGPRFTVDRQEQQEHHRPRAGPELIKLPLAAAAAVGMWATRQRCPSAASCPQPRCRVHR